VVGWLLPLLLSAGCWLSGSEDLGGGSCGIGMRGRTGFRSSAWMLVVPGWLLPLLAIAAAALAIQVLAVQALAVVAAALAPAAAAAAGADASDDP
jgi:hypothetical protein